MSRGNRARASTPFAVEYVEKPAEGTPVRVRSAFVLAALVLGLALLTALAAIVVLVMALGLATTATS